jgi:hypothetical protein
MPISPYFFILSSFSTQNRTKVLKFRFEIRRKVMIGVIGSRVSCAKCCFGSFERLSRPSGAALDGPRPLLCFPQVSCKHAGAKVLVGISGLFCFGEERSPLSPSQGFHPPIPTLRRSSPAHRHTTARKPCIPHEGFSPRSNGSRKGAANRPCQGPPLTAHSTGARLLSGTRKEVQSHPGAAPDLEIKRGWRSSGNDRQIGLFFLPRSRVWSAS